MKAGMILRELDALRRCANRGQPYGSDDWIDRVTKRLGLESAFRPRGRPCEESRNNGSCYLCFPRKCSCRD